MKVLDIFSGYTISSEGKVFNQKGREIAHQRSANGYIRVELWQNGKGKKYLLHRLLAEKFISNPKNKETVNHKNGIKDDNRLDNLEWVTRSENQKHAYNNGFQKGYKKPTKMSKSHKKALCGSRWEKEKHIIIVEGEEFTFLKSAALHFNVSRQTVLNRCNSKNFPHWKKEVHYAK